MTAASREGLAVFFDGDCPFCARAAEWLEREASIVPLALVDVRSATARRYASIPWMGRELVVVSGGGEVWAGPAAFLVCLWALRRLHWLGVLLAEPILLPLAVSFFDALSANRGKLGWMVGAGPCEHDRCGLSGAGPYR